MNWRRELYWAFAKPEIAFYDSFFCSVLAGNTDVVKARLHATGAYAMIKDGQGRTALHLAAQYRQKAIAELLLLTKRADVNDRADDGNTALHMAYQSGSSDIAELLLRHGADIAAKNTAGETPENVSPTLLDAEGNKRRQLVLKSIADAFPSRKFEEVVAVKWVINRGLIGDVVTDVVLAATSGLLGMSGPWLLPFGGHGEHFGVLARSGDIVIFHNGKQVESRKISEVFLRFKHGDDSALKLFGLGLSGEVSIALDLGPDNYFDARALVNWIHARYSRTSAKDREFLKAKGWLE